MTNQLQLEQYTGPVRYQGLTPEWARAICWRAIEGCEGAKNPRRFDSKCSCGDTSNLRCDYRGVYN